MTMPVWKPVDRLLAPERAGSSVASPEDAARRRTAASPGFPAGRRPGRPSHKHLDWVALAHIPAPAWHPLSVL
ncbi:hypothetical protein GQ464_002760 [Rhodocaloribacter litoris]|uniref:hypothetical protein n=1 Tax=Rhodocaloribacter litoris TaxID=2558931 RepID=UPI001E349F84|nr:hypothetical protein [Rhodocaloribacter litoris]QXD15887.1 hypothetical protein GQ464_002760 [Rhodocaloribacter litoris]